MTQLFSQRRRIDVLDKLITFFSADHSIGGLVMVGSSAEEALIDTFSGIDLLVVVNTGAVFPTVYRKWKNRIHDVFGVAYGFEIEDTIDRKHYAVMLDDYLEINLYFMPQKSLIAEQTPWRVIFDHSSSGDIAETLETTYQTERIVGPARKYHSMITFIWQPIIKCVASINREEVWRALHMLETIRHQTVELAALNHNIDTRQYAEVDKLPEMLLVQLRHTLPTSTDDVAIRRALHATVDLFFNQAIAFEETLQFQMADAVYEKMKNYLNAYA